MLEITGEHIKKLDDKNLRSLIGLLCETEMRLQDLPTKGVTWGGDQNAKDGGIDVRVEVSSSLKRTGFIPKTSTGIQVKKSDMPRSTILNEMRPNDDLRDSIVDLAENEGAYIIVSSHGSTSDTALQNRKDAMREAVSDLDMPPKIDFYDRGRIATWVRTHPSLIIWVRAKVGDPLKGWRPYGNWTGDSGEYILDDNIRLHEEANVRSEGMTALDGINKLRTSLSHPGNSVRLVGLSGVGKTRLVQALFDDQIDGNALNKSQVFYTDVGDNPKPDPRTFAEQIIALNSRAFLIVDNCPPEMHRRLTSVCSATGSLVSLMTVEYDVKDDQPEETEVFSLEAASEELIKKLIVKRYDYISQVDARNIAEFSGGNARIAIALADTVEKGESIAEIKNKVLFERLFYQGSKDTTDKDLLKSAEVFSLVYSFDFQAVLEEGSELQVLSNLTDRSVHELYGDVVELQRRDLIQERNKWRAVLPHAIANRLAKRALESTPVATIREAFENEGSERLLKSFSHRLSYLHKSDKANIIAESWLAEEGLLGNLTNLNSLEIEVFKNIAPVKPEVTLETIERAANSEGGARFTSRKNKNYTQFSRLLRSLAYDQNLFERAVELLCRFALSEDKDENFNSIRDILKSLFPLYLSGNHATAEKRLSIIRGLVYSDSRNKKQLGLTLLKSALKSSHFMAAQTFNFGARTRDFGFQPQSSKQAKKWLAKFLDFTKELIISDHELASEAKQILGDKYRGLWSKFGMYDELESVTEKIVKETNWKEGWTAIRSVIEYNKEKMSPELMNRLKTLANEAKPVSLEQKVRLYALSEDGIKSRLSHTVDIENDENLKARYKKVQEINRNLGESVAGKNDLFLSLLPEIVSSSNSNLYSFGYGLAAGSKNPKDMWNKFRDQLETLNENTQSYRALKGFLNGLSEYNPTVCDEILDDSIDDKVFGKVLPSLQASVRIDGKGFERLLKAIELSIAPIRRYTTLQYSGKVDELDEKKLSTLLTRISKEPNGVPIAIKILETKFHTLQNSDNEASNLIINIGKVLIKKVNFGENKDLHNDDYCLSLIIKKCLNNDDAKNEAEIFCKKLVDGISNLTVHVGSFPKVFEALATTHPFIFLDYFLGKDYDQLIPINFSSWSDEFNSNPLRKLNNEAAIEWCEIDPTDRYPHMASTIVPFKKKENDDEYEWTKLALGLIQKAPNKELVLDSFLSSFKPMSWGGSRANTMKSRLPLIVKLKQNENQVVAEWAEDAEDKFRKSIKSEYELEKERQGRAASFE